MREKLYILLIFCIIANTTTFAQKSKVKNLPTYEDVPIQFGISMGLSTIDFIFKRNLFVGETGSIIVPEVAKLGSGIHFNINSDFRLGNYFRFRILPGIILSNRYVSFWSSINGPDTLINNEPINISSNFVEMPFLIKYKAKRVNNYAPYLIAGVNPRFDIEGKKNSNINKNQAIVLKQWDFYFEMGIGIDFYNQYFKFAPELKLSLGLLDILNHNSSYTSTGNSTNYINSIEKLNSKLVMLTFHFE